MNILNIDKCPLCGKGHFSKERTCTDHYATGEQFDVFRCEECGFLFTKDVPDEQEIGRYYESPDYISHSDTSKGLVNCFYHYVRRYMLGKKAQLIRRCSGMSKGRLLDIGTGTGYFSHFMKEDGWQVDAIEKSEQARQFAKTHFQMEVAAPEAFMKYEAASFDVITLWHVMEHLQNLNEVWEQLDKLLKENGTLVLAVPNPESFDAQHYGSWWGAYDVPRHLWHFTPSTMKYIGSKHGFKLVELHPMPFDAFYVSMLSEKYKGSRCAFLKGIYVGTRAWLATLVKKERSSSLIYVFRKK